MRKNEFIFKNLFINLLTIKKTKAQKLVNFISNDYFYLLLHFLLVLNYCCYTVQKILKQI